MFGFFVIHLVGGNQYCVVGFYGNGMIKRVEQVMVKVNTQPDGLLVNSWFVGNFHFDFEQVS